MTFYVTLYFHPACSNESAWVDWLALRSPTASMPTIIVQNESSSMNLLPGHLSQATNLCLHLILLLLLGN